MNTYRYNIVKGRPEHLLRLPTLPGVLAAAVGGAEPNVVRVTMDRDPYRFPAFVKDQMIGNLILEWADPLFYAIENIASGWHWRIYYVVDNRTVVFARNNYPLMDSVMTEAAAKGFAEAMRIKVSPEPVVT